MAVMGLYRVTRTCQLLPMKDDFSSVAWSKLMERQRKEQDRRVLNAFIVAQVQSKHEYYYNKELRGEI